MSRIVAVAPVLPEHSYPQEQITEALVDLVCPPGSPAAAKAPLLRRLHRSAGVQRRHLVRPPHEYAHLDGFTGANEAWLHDGATFGLRAAREALEAARLAPDDVDLVLFTTVTGIAAPSLDARIAGPLGLRPDVKRLPLFGLGCVAGASGLARLHDHLRGHPDDVALLLSVELCSLTVQRDDPSTANLVASGLFGDGAAAVVVVGERRAAAMGLGAPTARSPRIVSSRSHLYPGTTDVLGWDVGGTGFRIVLSASLADVVETHLADDVKALLAPLGLDAGDVTRWVAHPGGPRVLEAAARALALEEGALAPSWASLARVGNLSSASVLHVLADVLAREQEGDQDDDGGGALQRCVLFALGPGFSAELVLLEWAGDTQR
ncbi:isopalmitoylresorcinol synthase [Quadrisphaera granulorum]|uniref:Isopalmitoylresorcinol synthase n=1 Tax=Quadrisphaera granulorum TaxID=317664 RepID=A0A316ADY9_9ACTN|nr:type III polyketide synthase [Quadrisphaera granulorum]PWJ55180.1 isopalmitoylresorcinol synthase [Quadrisphaera granulorum]SZE95689.1 isopalmitoylresorcinol synthase [Quadrisphaera granulorum]